VVLLDDEDLVRNGIRLILEAGGLQVVAEDTNGANVVELVRKHQPDVVLTDIQMPTVNGLEVTRRVTALPHPPAVVVLTTFDLDEYVYEALQAGATGFLLKDIAPRLLIAAVEQAVRGDAMLSPQITRRLITAYTGARESGPREDVLAALTAREREVAIAVAEGLSNAEVAARLGVSESTVKVHLTHVLSKLGLANRTKLAILVHEAGPA
jgi:DNA-binding NarL/FixJ family response regulator